MKAGTILFYIFLFAIIFRLKIAEGQNNIIPNGSFEIAQPGQSPGITSSGNTCIYTHWTQFDNDIQNWRVALHNNDKGVGHPDWIDVNFNTCGYGPTSVPSSDRFIAIKADLYKCRQKPWGCKIKKFHEAIAVGLEYNQSFISGKNYIIRYKVMPIAAGNFDGYPPYFACCIEEMNFCHLRIFLSEKGHLGWDQNNSDKQEVINANFAITLPPFVPDWIIKEAHFTVQKSNLKNLVLYAQSGGFIIDDVEIFEECDPNYLIQNKDYFPKSYFPGSQNGFNFTEKSSGTIRAGSNVGNPTAGVGPVIVRYGSAITYTAANNIILENGFIAEAGSNFKAIIAPCPNNISRLNLSSSVNFSQDGELEENDTMFVPQFLIIPNPASGKFMLNFIDENEKVKTKSFSQQNTISIYNPLSILIHQQICTSNNQIIDLSSRPKGIYFVKVTSNGQSFVEKVVIQ